MSVKHNLQLTSPESLHLPCKDRQLICRSAHMVIYMDELIPTCIVRDDRAKCTGSACVLSA